MTAIALPTDVPAAFQSAWNAHDMTGFAALFHERATFVNRFGHYVRGVDEIVALHRPIQETIYRDSTLFVAERHEGTATRTAAPSPDRPSTP